MTIVLKNKQTLLFDDFIFKCSVGKKGFSTDKIEGDRKTPSGTYALGNLYFRKDRVKKPKTSLKCIEIKKTMGWCNDIKCSRYYNKLIKLKKNLRSEKIFRRDYKYDYFIPIKYNWKKTTLSKGSAIFIHLTKNYTPTAGCISLAKKDFLILVSLINKNTKIKIP
tara:strand:+ start:2672 stop:3166 length:495 start_codon:yes stop_codon:yes gene_type:complete